MVQSGCGNHVVTNAITAVIDNFFSIFQAFFKHSSSIFEELNVIMWYQMQYQEHLKHIIVKFSSTFRALSKN
jgi:hypothetical protein